MEAALIEEEIRKGRKGNAGGVGRRPTVPSSSKSRASDSLSTATLPELQEQLKRKKALLANSAIIDELPDKGARIAAKVVELEKRISALQQSSLGSAVPLEEQLKGLAIGGGGGGGGGGGNGGAGNNLNTATSPSGTTLSKPTDDVTMATIPNPFKGNISARPPQPTIADERRRALGIYGRKEMEERMKSARQVKTLSLAECREAEAARQAQEMERMKKDAKERLAAAATHAAAPAASTTERREGAAWTTIRVQEEESDDEADLPPIDDGADGDGEEDGE